MTKSVTFALMTLFIWTLLLIACTSSAPIQQNGIKAAPTSTPPAIPHSLGGRSNCLRCHATGDKVVPDNHAGRTNTNWACLSCHKQVGQ